MVLLPPDFVPGEWDVLCQRGKLDSRLVLILFLCCFFMLAERLKLNMPS